MKTLFELKKDGIVVGQFRSVAKALKSVDLFTGSINRMEAEKRLKKAGYELREVIVGQSSQDSQISLSKSIKEDCDLLVRLNDVYLSLEKATNPDLVVLRRNIYLLIQSLNDTPEIRR